MSVFLPTFLSILAVSLLSFVGLFFFAFHKDTTARYLLYFVSFSAGAILGDVFIHMLPEISAVPDFLETASLLILCGIIASFVIEKIIHWHHCHIMPDHHHHHPVGIMSLIGDGVHNAVDGVLIAASFLVSTELGIATTLAVILHEIPQEISDFALLLYSGFTRKKALLFNFLSALSAFAGGFAVLAFNTSIPNLEMYLLPFAAGNFIYIAGADLIPELHKETRLSKAIIQLLCLLLGIAVMWTLVMFE